ncbi:protein kinase domain-containing protein [Spongorhabdus nitratireducens]
MIKRSLLLLLLFFSVLVEAAPPGGAVLMLTTHQANPGADKEVELVLVYDREQNIWRLPGGVSRDPGALHVNIAAQKAQDELHRVFTLDDFTNLNRSYTFDNQTVYIMGDRTCHGLFLIANGKTPVEGYRYPARFEAARLKWMIRDSQAKLQDTPANAHLFRVSDVRLIKLKMIREWLKANNILDEGLFPKGRAVVIADPEHAGQYLNIDYGFLAGLQQSMVIESPTCPIVCMLDLMDDPATRAVCDGQLAGFFPGDAQEEIFPVQVPPAPAVVGVDHNAGAQAQVADNNQELLIKVLQLTNEWDTFMLMQPDLDLMLGGIDAKPIIKDPNSEGIFRSQFKLFLELMGLNAKDFSIDKFPLFVESASSDIIKNWTAGHSQVENTMALVLRVMQLLSEQSVPVAVVQPSPAPVVKPAPAAAVAVKPAPDQPKDQPPLLLKRPAGPEILVQEQAYAQQLKAMRGYFTTPLELRRAMIAGVDLKEELKTGIRCHDFEALFRAYHKYMAMRPGFYKPEYFQHFVKSIGEDFAGLWYQDFMMVEPHEALVAQMFQEFLQTKGIQVVSLKDLNAAANDDEDTLVAAVQPGPNQPSASVYARSSGSGTLKQRLDRFGGQSVALRGLQEHLVPPKPPAVGYAAPAPASIVSVQGKVLHLRENNVKNGVKPFNDQHHPTALGDLYHYYGFKKTRQAQFHNDRYYIQPVRGSGNCLYLAYLSGWLHALVEDVVTGRNPGAIDYEINKLLNQRAGFRDYLANTGRAVGLVDTTDEFVNFLQELNGNPTVAHLHQMIMPTHPVMMRCGTENIRGWGGKEQRLEPLICYLRNYTVFLTREDLYREVYQTPEARERQKRWVDLMGMAEFFPGEFGCAEGVKNFTTYYGHLKLNPLDAFLLHQSQMGVNATAIEMRMLYTIRPFSVCHQEGHEEWNQECVATFGFKRAIYPEGERIVILQQPQHFVAMIPVDLCYVPRQAAPAVVNVPVSVVNQAPLQVQRQPLPVVQVSPFQQGKSPAPKDHQAQGYKAPAKVAKPHPKAVAPAAVVKIVEDPKRTQQVTVKQHYQNVAGHPGKRLIEFVRPNHVEIMQHFLRDRVERANIDIDCTDYRGAMPIQLPGPWMNRVRLYRKIGQGGQGAIYAASFAEENHPTRVIKVSDAADDYSRTDMTNCRRFDQTFRDDMAHPCIALDYAQFYDQGLQQFFQMMDRYPTDLQHMIPGAGKGVDKHLAMVMIHQMLQGIAHMHVNGWIHRDIKPGNTMIEMDGSRIKLIDFGMSKRVGTGAQAGQGLDSMKGTPGYMLMQMQAGGKYNGFAADMTALAVTYFRLRAGFGEDLIEIPDDLRAANNIPYYQKVLIAYQRLHEEALALGGTGEAGVGEDAGVTQSIIMRLYQVFGGEYDDDEAMFLRDLLNPENGRHANSETLYTILGKNPLMVRARTLTVTH